VTSLERSPTMIQRQGLTLTLWWQYLELLALLTLSPFALRYRPLLAELGGPRTHSLRWTWMRTGWLVTSMGT